MADEPNPSFVGRAASKAGINIDSTGFKALRTELTLANRVLGEGLLAGVLMLATGGNKVKAVWESIKWGSLARAGLSGFAGLILLANGLSAGIRKLVEETGALQAAMDRLSQTKMLTKNFEVFLGSVQAAKTRVAELYAFAASSKFNFSEIAGASRTLTIFTNGLQGGGESLKMLGKISSATSVPLEDLAGAVGQTANAIRNGNDFSGSISSLRAMGVVTEGTAKKMETMAAQGASTSAIMDTFNASIKGVADSVGEAGLNVTDFAAQTEKAQTELLAAFGAPFVEQNRHEMELTGKVYQNFTGVAGELGKMLRTISAPFEKISTTGKEIAATSWFAGAAGEAAKLLTAVVPTAAAIGLISGSMKLLRTGAGVVRDSGFKGLGARIAGTVSPIAKGAEWAARAKRLEAAGSSPIAVEAATKIGKAWFYVGDVVVPMLLRGLGKLATTLARLAGPGLLVAGLALVLQKAWAKYNAEVEKSQRLMDMSSDIQKSSAALKDQADKVQNLDDYLQLLTAAQTRYNEALEKQAQIYANKNLTADDRHAADAAVAIAGKELGKVERADTSQLGQDKAGVEYAQQRREIEKDIRDLVFEAQLARASDGEKAVMLAQKQVEYEKIAANYRKGEAARPDIAKAQGIYDASAGRDANVVAAKKAVFEQAQSELNKITPGAFTPNPVASSSRERKIKEATEARDNAMEDLQNAQGGPGKEKAFANLIAALKRGTVRDQYEASAREVENDSSRTAADKSKTAGALRAKGLDSEIVSQKEATEKAAQIAQQRRDMVRQQLFTGISQHYAGQALGVTSESYQGQDTLARQRMQENKERFAESTKSYKPGSGDVLADIAYKQQAKDLELENAGIQKEIDERARQFAREKVQWNTAIHVHELNNEALRASAKGNFAQADMALLAAQKAADDQAQLDRAHELRLQGVGQEAAAAMVAAEQKEREAERATKAEVFRTAENRRIREKELSNTESGLGPNIGVDGAAARKLRVGMEDFDALKDETMKNIQELGPGHEKEASNLALRSVSADIIANAGQLLPGSGQVASSDAKLGLGGGVYAGVSGDPQLAATNRIADLNQKQYEALVEIKGKLGMGVK